MNRALPEPSRELVLPPGTHEWDIPEMVLPDDVPASFEGRYEVSSYVRYEAAAVIDIRMGFDRFSRTTFTVCPRLPSTLPQLLAPLQAPERNKTVFKPCYLPPFCCNEEWCAAPTHLPAPHKAPGCLRCLTGARGYLAAARASS